jgi:site-specific DNA recombinase
MTHNGTMSTSRALSVVRLSSLKDESTSPERQREHNLGTIDRNGWTLAGEAEDLDVSATRYSPMERPELGNWLGHRANEFDVIVFWRLDRFIRSLFDFTEIIRWCEANGKNLVSATEPFDLNTPFGRAIAGILAVLAELEARTIRERVLDAHRKLRTDGRWAGGPPPYGYVSAPREGGGRRLVIDPETRAVVIKAADQVIRGASLVSIARDFNARGILTNLDRNAVQQGRELDPENRRSWDQTGLSRILRNPATMGIQVAGRQRSEQKVIRGEDGRPRRVAEPLLSQDTWDRLQRALDNRTVTKSRTATTSPLLGVTVCGQCGRPIYHKIKTGSGGKVHRYYTCPGRNGVTAPCPDTYFLAWQVEEFTEDHFLNHRLNMEPTPVGSTDPIPVLGDAPVQRRVLIPGEDHAAELVEVEQAIRDLIADRSAGLYRSAPAVAEYTRQMTVLEQDHEQLSALPSRPDQWCWESTGQTWRDLWSTLDVEGRRTVLRDSGVQVTLAPRDWSISVPEDLLDRARQALAEWCA